MADLSGDDIIKLATLARLELSEAEVEEYSRELSALLQYVEQLQEADIDGLSPTNQVTGLTNVTRDDSITDYGYSTADLLRNVPHTENNQIKVNRMIG